MNVTLGATHWNECPKDFDFEHTGIHIFKISIEEYFLKNQIRYAEVLPAEESEKSARFYQRNDQIRYLTTRHALRNILSHFLSVEAAEIQFHLTKNKKPYAEGIHFNVGHSGDCILIAVGDHPLGIDVEQIREDIDMDVLVSECFSIEERLYYEEHGNKLFDFYTVWTRKESILKASGEGLTDQLKQLNSLAEKIERLGISYMVRHEMLNKEYIWSISTTEIRDGLKFHYWNYL